MEKEDHDSNIYKKGTCSEFCCGFKLTYHTTRLYIHKISEANVRMLKITMWSYKIKND